ncbi:uncharacterized protein TRIADDRAFT_62122 [Trichoplax adhaerens]|uniref:Cation-transporting P-type ATPase C-terminal domain-containing protein n=1 Tax=Trichoplax adhaerens TaxID=10228 RepID=B3SCW8_TRIAD|nr:hypothetical protein TRIADDRAFT_62122 [Trichoplax adhaerens]EDV19392.1 hypothetical protein TRIADDRAFT_62122 [Trichoplax adhaerens]|eukprot:XP_002118081.1 hypothetical protein TRIADDRAFT_62122 [Trichoplax adhaerens]
MANVSWKRKECTDKEDVHLINIDKFIKEKNKVYRGLDSRTAFEKLYNELQLQCKLYITKLDSQSWRSLILSLSRNRHSSLSIISVGLLIVAICMLVLASIFSSTVNHVVEILILTMFGVVNVYIAIKEEKLRRTERARRMLDILSENFGDEGKSFRGDISYISKDRPINHSFKMVWAYRDGNIVNLPQNLLVEEDVILLAPGQTAPIKVCKLDSSWKKSACVLDADQTFTLLENAPDIGGECLDFRGNFLVLESFLANLSRDELLDVDKKPVSPVENGQYWIIQEAMFKYIVPLLSCASILCNALRLILIPDDVGPWWHVMLTLQVYVIIPYLPLFYPIFWTVGNIYGVAKVLNTLNNPEDVEWKVVFRTFWEIVQGSSQFLPRSCNIVHLLGRVTSFCCMDQQSLLSPPNPSVSKVVFPDPDNDRQIEERISVNTFNSVQTYTNYRNSLDGSKVSSQYSESATNENPDIEMKDANVISHVKVLDLSIDSQGLNALVTISNLSNHNKLNIPDKAFGIKTSLPITIYEWSLRQLSLAIGFSEGAKKAFKQYVEIYYIDKVQKYVKPLKRCRVPYMLSACLIEESIGNVQMFSQGGATITLDRCSEYWTGSGICKLPVNSGLRKAILDVFRRNNSTGYCLILAYKPIVESSSDASTDHLSNKKLVGSDEEAVLRLLESQIFIGMLCFEHEVRQNVVSLIEHLDHAGIRFVLFSSENEIKSRAFSKKLGLETGWNCHISLMEPENNLRKRTDTNCGIDLDDSNLDNDEFEATHEYHTSTAAKLPCGTAAIRPHLETVDDVPLLVPLFTDCTHEASLEMITIMQEYNEITCCVGSSMNCENSKLFSRSDISIAVNPEFPKHCENISDEDRDHSVSYEGKTPLVISSLLNTFCCPLLYDCNNYVEVIEVMKEARILCYGLHSCCLFLVSCQISLSLLLLLSSFLLMPPPLAGYHILWFTCAIIPLIGTPLILSRSSHDMMSLMTGKNNQHRKNKKMKAMYLLLRFVPSVIVSLICYYLTLNFNCNKNSGGECHFLLGNRNKSGNGSWNGWLTTNHRELTIAQNQTFALMCIYFGQKINHIYKNNVGAAAYLYIQSQFAMNVLLRYVELESKRTIEFGGLC